MNTKQTKSTNEPRNTAPTGCCGGPAPAGVSACCADDAAVKSSGGTGCGCSATPVSPTPLKASCCA
jgi:hypothetical protein